MCNNHNFFLHELLSCAWTKFNKKYVGKNAAMIVGNKLMSAPRINAQITKGELLIVGNYDEEEAESIAKCILPKKKKII